jgi:hypothetical protein
MRRATRDITNAPDQDECPQYRVFVSHGTVARVLAEIPRASFYVIPFPIAAGEQKMQLVDHVRDRFTNQEPHLNGMVFVDEWSLEPGDRAMDNIWQACRGACVGER